MRAARKLRIVEGCPQPDPPPFRPIQYGARPWPKRLAPSPTTDEITIRARAQSLMSRGGVRAELPDIETARRVIAEHESMPAATTPQHDSPSRAVAAGAHSKENQ